MDLVLGVRMSERYINSVASRFKKISSVLIATKASMVASSLLEALRAQSRRT